MRTRTMKVIVCLFLVVMIMGVSFAAMQVKKYEVHDKTRENPPVIAAGEQIGQPPSDAIVLFDGKDTSQWVSERRGGGDVPWKIENGYIHLQDHNNPIRFRNIWIRELPEQPYLIK